MSWKTFRFFDYEEVKDPETEEPFGRLKDLGITCCSCGRGMMVFGDASGCLHILYRLSDMFSFKAYAQRIQHLYQLKTRSIVITVGDDEDFTPLIRVWNLEKRDKAGNPSLARTIKAGVREGKMQQCGVMAITAHENMNLIAVGYKDGTVQLLKGNITRDRASRQRIIHQETEAGVYITGLAFRQQAGNPVLMVSTTTAVYSFIITDNPKPIQVGMMGCELNCSTMTDHSQDHKFVIGRPELVQFFTTESPAQCFGFEGEKSLLRWYRGYLITASMGVRGMSRMPSGATPETRTLTVYDIQNQLVAYQTSFPTRIVDVLSEWGSLYVLLKDGRFFRLDELDTKSKLETLFKKNLYHIAISLAKSQSYSDGLVEIFKEYGDHLYSKGDYDGAIDQYKLTIGSLEPSYVIRRFLDAQRIHNLTDYLKVLHEKSQANADHTTLLLNCYTKLKNEEQLDKFVREEQAVFDVEAAIKVCRQATFFEHALTLAERFSQHDWFLLILLEDLHRHQKALNYIASLKCSAAVQSMTKYGRTLIKVLPIETTDLLIALCTDWTVDRRPSPATDIVAPDGPPLVIPSTETVHHGNPAKFIPIFVDKKEHLTHFLEEMIRLRDCWSVQVCNSLLELYLTPCGEAGKIQKEKAFELLKNANAKYEVEHALMLARTCDFRKGILYLYEKAGRYQQILDYHIEHRNVEMVMDTCRRFNHQDPSLWVQALSFYASREDCRDKIPQVLHHIEEQHLLQPLMVVKLLAENKCATLSDIKPYIVRHLEEQNEAIIKDERLIREYRENTTIMREQISELQSKAKVFQVMKCSQCKRGLTLPAVHFLCQHSFHQNCMEDDYENECPICARENRKVLENIQRQEQSTGLHEQFHSQLQRSSDGFSVVAEYFGRGVFGKVSKGQTRTA